MKTYEDKENEIELRRFVTTDGIASMLSSGYVKGIGQVFGRKIADKFGNEILETDFDFKSRLKDIPGLGETKIEEMTESLQVLKAPVDVLAFLYSAGLADTEVEKIISHYKKNIKKALVEDPFDMVENVWKVSFFTADKIGRLMGISEDDPRRIRGAILTAIKIYAERGNMFATEEEVVRTASNITKTDTDKILPLLKDLASEERVIESRGGYYLPPYYIAEKEAAEKIRYLSGNRERYEGIFEIPTTDLSGNPLSGEQKKAISTVMNNAVTVITGGPGTGKTTTIRGLIRLFEDIGRKVVLAAPTGRAAKRMSELSGAEAKTIHRLLGYSMGRGYRNKSFDADVLIIDEASMLEQVLFNHLLQALRQGTKVVLVGDTGQLPSIGAGDVLNHLISSGTVPVVNLTENFRQKEGSGIADSAARIKAGCQPERQAGEDFILIEEDSAKLLKSRLLELVSREIPEMCNVEARAIQVVTPQQEGPLGAKQLNMEIQERVNPEGPELKSGSRRFRLGDRVMQKDNDSGRNVYNGETGWISDVDTELKILEVTFNDGKKLKNEASRLRELTLAYATTVHKLQGSETDYMVMLLTDQHRPMLYRNLLYTGVSRARKLCVLLVEGNSLNTALENTGPTVRRSNFSDRLLK